MDNSTTKPEENTLPQREKALHIVKLLLLFDFQDPESEQRPITKQN